MRRLRTPMAAVREADITNHYAPTGRGRSPGDGRGRPGRGDRRRGRGDGVAPAGLGQHGLHETDAPLGEPRLAVGQVQAPQAAETLVVARRLQRVLAGLEV